MGLRWAWQASREVDSPLRARAKFVLAAIRDPALCSRLEKIDAASPMGRLLAEWPQTVGNLVWPYQCAAWGPRERFARIQAHLDVLERIPGLQLAPDEKLDLVDLSKISPGVSLIIDRPPWLAREGHLTLSLFKDDFRAFSLSFSLSHIQRRELFIGGIQGRQDPDILAMYRDLTKDFHGVRPRDFMLEMLRLFSATISVESIYAVADDHKISRHPYFGKKGPAGLFYDDVWQERGGIRVAETHFELPLGGSRRALEDIAAKKRSMYRRRYEMLDQIEAELPEDLTKAERRHFDAR